MDHIYGEFEYFWDILILWKTSASTFFKIMSCIFTMKYVFSTQFHGRFCHILELGAMYKLISYISLTVSGGLSCLCFYKCIWNRPPKIAVLNEMLWPNYDAESFIAHRPFIFYRLKQCQKHFSLKVFPQTLPCAININNWPNRYSSSKQRFILRNCSLVTLRLLSKWLSQGAAHRLNTNSIPKIENSTSGPGLCSIFRAHAYGIY